MKRFFIFTIAAMVLVACQNQSQSTTASNDSITDKHVDTTAISGDSVKTITLQNGIHCFTYTKNQDTISMQLVLKDSSANGRLIYNFYEKDKNIGTFKGFLKKDTLLANYIFSSEGMLSARQIVFLVKGNILLSGSGSMKEQKNRLVFSNKKDITFDNNVVLKPVDCGAQPFK